MSRYTDCDNDDENWALNYGRWEHNSRTTLKSKRGRRALRDLRDALLALPDKRLIEGAVCTVGAQQRLEAHEAQARRRWEKLNPQYRPPNPWMDQPEKLGELVTRDGEGVCAIGAYVWYQKVKAGADPAEAFASLPDIEDEDADGLAETAYLGRDAGMAFTLAWNLAYRNDETFRRMTPEERYAAFLAWIDTELAGQVASTP